MHTCSVCSTAEQEVHVMPGNLPHPNNPSDYCSVIPPTQAAGASAPPPSVLVPVLKRDGKDIVVQFLYIST